MELLKQSFKYYTIDLIKNYSILDLKLDSPPVFPSNGIIIRLLKKSKSNTDYYYSDVDTDIVSQHAVGIKSTFELATKKPHETINENQLKRHYGNPFARVSVNFIERSIKILNNNLYIRIFEHHRWRGFNKKFYRKSQTISIIKINLSNGNITIFESINRGKQKQKYIRINNFSKLQEFIINGNFFSKKLHPENVSIINKQEQTINDNEFLKIILNYLESYSDPQWMSTKDLFNLIVEFFVRKKEIKIPNDYKSLITKLYPTEKFLKKNNRKLVQSVLDSFGLKSKFSIKFLHENPKISVSMYSKFANFFGKDYPKYMSSLSPIFPKFLETIDEESISIKYRKTQFEYDLEKVEKENLVKVINDFFSIKENPEASNKVIFQLIRDHLDMHKKLKEYQTDVKINAINYESFVSEHEEFTKLTTLIKKGWTIEYQYDNRMVRHIENSFVVVFDNKEMIFNPIILKREEEYDAEGNFMHHCVATYSDKLNSLIVSLRINNGADRVTCEFDKKTGECLQSRHFCNQSPPKHFEESLDILKSKVSKFGKQRLLNHLDVKKVPVKINGVEVKNIGNIIPLYHEIDLF